METHNGEEHSEPRDGNSLKDDPEFVELAALLKSIPPDRAIAAGTEFLTESPPDLKVFAPDGSKSAEPQEPPGVSSGRNPRIREDSEPTV